MFGLLVKVVGGSSFSSVDPVLIPGSLQLRQKSGVGPSVGQEIANSAIFYIFLKIEILIQF